MYNWFTLLYSRNWHSSVKQLYSNKINVKKRLIDQLAEFSGVKDQIWKSNISIEDVRGFWKDLLRSSVIRAVRILTGKKLKRIVRWFREVWAGLRESHLELATLDLEKQKWWPEFEESWRCWERHSIKAVSLGKYISQQTTACRWCVLVTQTCLTLRDTMDCSQPDSSVSRILWARTSQWVAIPFSRDLRDPGIKPISPSLQADSLLSEPPEKPTSRLWPEWKVYLPLHPPTFWFPIGDSPGRTQRKARKHGYWLVLSTKVGIYGHREECRMCRNECKWENKEYPIPVIKALF